MANRQGTAKDMIAAMLVLWGSKGSIAKWYDAPAIWRLYCGDVTGRAVASGHYIAEEAPAALLEALGDFL